MWLRRAVVVLPLAFGVACTESHGSNEIVVATVTRCTESRAAEPITELGMEGRRQAFFSVHPLAQLKNLGGRTMTAPRIVAVFFGEDTMRRQTEALMQSYGCTPFWRDAVGEYGVGDALYERTIVVAEVPPVLATPDLGAFEAWVVDSEAAGMFGALTEEHALMFFLPPKVTLLSDDCSARLGAHSGVVTKDQRHIAYAYFDACTTTTNADDLATRTHAITHELIEMSMDPDPAIPAWNTLDVGIAAPSLRPSIGNGDTEGADFCNDHLATAADYPFEIARNFSNRSARAGRDPCDLAAPLAPLAALRDNRAGMGPTSIDLSSGAAHVVLDIFAEDPSDVLSLEAFAVIADGDASSEYSLLGATRATTHDGDVAAIDLRLTLPFYAASEVAKATRTEVLIQLCTKPVNVSNTVCGQSRIPISALPPVQPPPDAGAGDAGH